MEIFTFIFTLVFFQECEPATGDSETNYVTFETQGMFAKCFPDMAQLHEKILEDKKLLKGRSDKYFINEAIGNMSAMEYMFENKLLQL